MLQQSIVEFLTMINGNEKQLVSSTWNGLDFLWKMGWAEKNNGSRQAVNQTQPNWAGPLGWAT